MSILTRALFALILVRLLLPPGVCVCRLSSPAARLAVAAFGGDPAAVPDDHDDDHHPGCPASHLSLGLGVQPAGPGDVGLCVAGVVALADPPDACTSNLAASHVEPSPPPTPRHLALCVLLV